MVTYTTYPALQKGSSVISSGTGSAEQFNATTARAAPPAK